MNTEGVFEALGDPTRRRILELLTDGEQSAGTLLAAIRVDRPISQPTVSQHLRVLREAGLVSVRSDGTLRIYAIAPTGIEHATTWLTARIQRAPFAQQFDALETELARGRSRHTPARSVRPTGT
ncbi:MAG: ArsR/SmtB family transcription factor [Brooklawnia sp.]